MATLQEKLRDVFETRKEKTMFIVGDPTLRYGEIIAVIDAAKGAGVEKVGIVTEGMRRGDRATSAALARAAFNKGRPHLGADGLFVLSVLRPSQRSPYGRPLAFFLLSSCARLRSLSASSIRGCRFFTSGSRFACMRSRMFL